MDKFAITIDAALKQPQTNQDIQETLAQMHQISNMYSEDDADDMKRFFIKCSSKIEYLFWIYQNQESNCGGYTDEYLLDIFDQFETMKQTHDQSIKQQSQSMSMSLLEQQFDTECLL